MTLIYPDGYFIYVGSLKIGQVVKTTPSFYQLVIMDVRIIYKDLDNNFAKYVYEYVQQDVIKMLETCDMGEDSIRSLVFIPMDDTETIETKKEKIRQIVEYANHQRFAQAVDQ